MHEAPAFSPTVQQYLNVCAQVGEHEYKVKAIHKKLEGLYLKLEELDAQILAEHAQAQAEATPDLKV